MGCEVFPLPSFSRSLLCCFYCKDCYYFFLKSLIEFASKDLVQFPQFYPIAIAFFQIFTHSSITSSSYAQNTVKGIY